MVFRHSKKSRLLHANQVPQIAVVALVNPESMKLMIMPKFPWMSTLTNTANSDLLFYDDDGFVVLEMMKK